MCYSLHMIARFKVFLLRGVNSIMSHNEALCVCPEYGLSG